MTMIRRSAILISLLVGSICFEFTFAKSGSPSTHGPGKKRKLPSGQDNGIGDDAKTLAFIDNAFSNILLSKLEDDEVLTSLFSNPIDKDLSLYIAGSITESLVLEVGLVDPYSMLNVIVDAFLKLKPNASPKAYCTAMVNAISKILLSNDILNYENYFNLADTVNNIILKIAPDILKEQRNGKKAKKDTSTDLDIKTTNDIDVNFADGLDINADVGLDAISNIGIGLGADIGGSVGLDAAKLDSRNNNVGLNTNANLNANAGVNPALSTDTSAVLPPGTNLNPVDSGVNIDLKLSQEANLIFKSELANSLLKDRNFRYVFNDGVPSNALKQIAAAICQYISKAFGISRSFLLPVENSIGNLSLDSTPCPEQYANVITGMLTNLFSQAKFITKATASLQATIASNAITSGIVNFLSISAIPGAGLSINENSFNSYFSILNGLEKLPYVGVEAASSKLPLSVKLTYASTYASKFAKILFSNLVSSAKFSEVLSLVVPAFNSKIIAREMGNYVAKAFGSPNPDLFYDLYFKALLTSGININRVNYAKILSSETARALFLSGYFLSGNLNVQAAIAKNAIIRALISKLRPLSTQVVLFPNVLGLSWITQLRGASPAQILLKYGTVVGLSVGTSSGSGQGLDQSANTNLNSVLGAGVNANTVLGTGVNVNSGLGADLGVNVGLGAGTNIGLGANIGLGGALGANIGLGDGLNVNAGLGNGLNANVDLGGGLRTNVGLGTGLDTNSGLGVGVGLGTNVGLGGDVTSSTGLGSGLASITSLNTGNVINANLGTGLGVNVGLGGGLGTNNGLGLGGGLDANFGLGGGLGVNANLGGLGANANLGGLGANANLGGLGTNFGLGGGINGNIGSTGLNANAGLGAGLGINTGLGIPTGSTGLNANAGLGTGLGINTGLGISTGLNTGLGTTIGLNTGLGAATGVNSNLVSNIGVNSGLGAGSGINSGSGTGLGINSNLGTGFGTNTGLGTSLNSNSGLRTNFGLGGNSNLGGQIFQGFGADVTQGGAQNEQVSLPRRKRSLIDSGAVSGTLGLETELGISAGIPIAEDAGLGLNSEAVLGAGLTVSDSSELLNSLRTDQSSGVGVNLDANVGVGANLNTGINQGVSLGLNAGASMGLQSTTKGTSSSTQLSVLNVLPLILSNKLYQSTALYTSISMVGVRKIIALVSQAMASEFGLPIASVFLRSFSDIYINNSDKSFEINVVALAKATTEALAGIGFFNSSVSVSTANQLADAIVSKYSSLITTSLDSKDCVTTPQWTYLLNQDLVQPPLIPGYNTYSNNLPNSAMK